MIFYWMRKFWLHLAWLFTKPSARDVAQLDRNMTCPVCGHRRGSLKCVEVQSAKANSGIAEKLIMAQHTCGECLARWFEQPVARVSSDQVWPATDSSEFERRTARKVQAA